MRWSLPGLAAQYPLVMGILNVTPDSFSDGGKYSSPSHALAQAATMEAAGADIIDIGGESTRPGAAQVSVDEELERVIPVITQIRSRSDIALSIDTNKAEVMREAVAAGACMINDVTALSGPGAVQVAADCEVPVVLMHMKGTPQTMQREPRYQDVVSEVRDYLGSRVKVCIAAGIPASQIIVDPGFGFGKDTEHNLRLFRSMVEVSGGQPLLVGVSRKSMIGKVLDRPVEQRLYGSLALAALATWMTATIIRVHDVSATVDVVKMIRAIRDVEYTATSDIS